MSAASPGASDATSAASAIRDGPAPPAAPRVVVLALAAAVVAATVRVLVLREMEASNPLFRVPVLDEAVYLREARRMRDGGAPDALAPLVSLVWPRLLATLGVVERSGASAVNVVLGAATAGLAAAGAARWARSLLAGGIAGAIVALSGALAFQDTTAGIETLLGFLTLATALALVRTALAPAAGRAAVAGAILGATVLARGTHLALAVAVVPAFFARRRAPPDDLDVAGRRRFVPVAAFAGVLVLTLTAGSLAALRAPSSWGVNVWLGNCAGSRATLSFGTDEFPMDPDGERDAVVSIAEGAAGRPLSTSAVNVWWLGRALDEAVASPGATLAHLGKKALLLVYAPDMGGNHDADVEREFSRVLGVLPVSAAWILVLGAAGWVLVRRSLPGAAGAGLALAGFATALVVVFPLTRYRMPIVPFAAVLVGVGFASAAARRASRRDAVAAVVTLVALTAASFAASAIRPPTHAEAWTNLGLAETDHGAQGSDRWFRRALDEAPGHPPAAVMCGVMALDAKSYADALVSFDAALVAAADDRRWTLAARDAAQGRCRALSGLLRHADALTSHEIARRRFPDDPEIAIDGVFVALAAGDRADAVRRLEAARRVAPGHPRLAEAERAVGR